MDNWLNEKINITYKELFDIIYKNEVLSDNINDEDILDEISFITLIDVYKKINNCNPYDKIVSNNLKNNKMNKLNYLKGDATAPVGEGKKIICHVCNNIGGWGAGFVLALSRKWKEPEKSYREWFRGNEKSFPFQLGEVQFVKVENDIVVANMIGQHTTSYSRDKDGNLIPPIRYNAIEECLNKVAEYAKQHNCSVHMPKIGAGLAGGDWNKIEEIINKCLVEKNIQTYVYLFD